MCVYFINGQDGKNMSSRWLSLLAGLRRKNNKEKQFIPMKTGKSAHAKNVAIPSAEKFMHIETQTIPTRPAISLSHPCA